MSDRSATTRRRVLSTLGLAIAGVSAGCSAIGGDGTPGSDTPGEVRITDEGSGSPPTTAERSTPSVGEYDFDRPVAAFERMLVDLRVSVRSIEVVDGRVQLVYIGKSEYAHEIAAGIETVVVSFIRMRERGWDVEGVDVTILQGQDTESELGQWRLESRWVEHTLSGEWSRTELLERTLATYHGDLERGDHTHGGESEHTHDDGESHTHDDGESHTHEDGGDHTHAEPDGHTHDVTTEHSHDGERDHTHEETTHTEDG